MDDAELVAIARQAIAERYGLTAQQGARLHGSTAKALIEDAKLMRSELGLAPIPEGPDRDGQGRFTGSTNKDFNELIRAASGR
jgi:hypothetical protein